MSERSETPAVAFAALAAASVVLTLVVWFTDWGPTVDFAIVGVQVLGLVVMISLGVRNGRIHRERTASAVRRLNGRT